MKLRSHALGLALLAQLALLLPPPVFAQEQTRQSSSVNDSEPSRARQTLAWSIDRLTELDATVATLEQDVAQHKGEARARAQIVLQELRGSRESYRLKSREAVANAKTWTDAQAIEAHKSLDESWNAFQVGVADYLDATQADLATRRAVLENEFKIRQESWQKSIDELRSEANRVTIRERKAIENRIDALKAHADRSIVLVERLREASRESWDTVGNSYAEAQQLFSNTYASIRESIADAAKGDARSEPADAEKK
ncbi:hypothetical protein ACSEPQ_04355 [Pseudomonas aeruginosa]